MKNHFYVSEEPQTQQARLQAAPDTCIPTAEQTFVLLLGGSSRQQRRREIALLVQLAVSKLNIQHGSETQRADLFGVLQPPCGTKHISLIQAKLIKSY